MPGNFDRRKSGKLFWFHCLPANSLFLRRLSGCWAGKDRLLLPGSIELINYKNLVIVNLIKGVTKLVDLMTSGLPVYRQETCYPNPPSPSLPPHFVLHISRARAAFISEGQARVSESPPQLPRKGGREGGPLLRPLRSPSLGLPHHAHHS